MPRKPAHHCGAATRRRSGDGQDQGRERRRAPASSRALGDLDLLARSDPQLHRGRVREPAAQHQQQFRRAATVPACHVPHREALLVRAQPFGDLAQQRRRRPRDVGHRGTRIGVDGLLPVPRREPPPDVVDQAVELRVVAALVQPRGDDRCPPRRRRSSRTARLRVGEDSMTAANSTRTDRLGPPLTNAPPCAPETPGNVGETTCETPAVRTSEQSPAGSCTAPRIGCGGAPWHSIRRRALRRPQPADRPPRAAPPAARWQSTSGHRGRSCRCCRRRRGRRTRCRG